MKIAMNWTPTALRQQLSPPWSKRLWSSATAIAGTVAIALTACPNPALADPFRSASPREMDDQTEAAFEAMFVQGNYTQAAELLETAAPDEPMALAMQASIAYLNRDWDGLKVHADRTLAVAQRLIAEDPLRGHLYTAVAHFMDGAYTLSTEGTIRATPVVLGKLRLVFDNFNQAESVDPTDPELNLIKGYMDLMLAVNLPFSSPEQAIARLEQYGSPSYLVQRGLAVAYRDLGQYDAALTAVEQALEETPDNPDLYYLKAQIVRLQGDDLATSLQYFRRALQREEQLPEELADQIAYEFCRTRNELRDRDQNCRRWVEERHELADSDEDVPDQI
ncbi:MAG: Sll0314/Alr1548 family TPR repeat-containing protein [Synechococcales bacterium]|nr:Sll0314/Alr1548 family TPR repeat-containing protein [Synechococcales bacterium]